MPKPKSKQPEIEKWGYIDLEGRWVIPAQFDHAYPHEQGRGFVVVNKKYGHVDREGEWLLRPIYDGLGELSNGLISAEFDGKWGFIDDLGNTVITPQFDFAWDFSEGLARVEVDGQVGFVDTTGQFVIAPAFSKATDFSDGVSLVRVGPYAPERAALWFINREGKRLWGPFFHATYFSDGWAGVTDDKGHCFIDRNGRVVLRLPKRLYADHFYEGLAAAKESAKKGGSYLCGYLDRKGKWAIKPRFEFAGRFENGLAKVEQPEGKTGLIDKSGKFVIRPEYDILGDLCEGRIRFESHGLEGYFDERGRVAIKPQFILVQRFSEGLAPVCVKS